MTNLECRLVHPDYSEALGRFFQRLVTSGTHCVFHPHPLTVEEAAVKCSYSGKDIYYLLVESDEVIGYGMLRGWDDGFAVPSLGIVIDPCERGRGLGRFLMELLHRAARERGATQVRLKVYPDNNPAVELYKSMGYEFVGEHEGQILGILEFESDSQT